MIVINITLLNFQVFLCDLAHANSAGHMLNVILKIMRGTVYCSGRDHVRGDKGGRQFKWAYNNHRGLNYMKNCFSENTRCLVI